MFFVLAFNFVNIKKTSFFQISTDYHHAAAAPVKQNMKKYKKPKRPCYFCGEMQAQLRRHIKTVHKDHSQVRSIEKLPSSCRHETYADLRKKAITKENRKILREGTHRADQNQIHHERSLAKPGGHLVVCGYCEAVLSRAHISKHEARCVKAQNAPYKSLPIPLSLMASEGFPEGFRDILKRFRDNEIGEICRTDRMILLVGKFKWEKSAHKERKNLMTDMRRLASLLIQFQQLAGIDCEGTDLLDYSKFSLLEKALDLLSRRSEDDTDISPKAGLKLSLGYLLKTACTVLKGEYLISDNTGKCLEIDRFSAVLEAKWPSLFASAKVHIDLKRQTTLRKPEQLPQEDAVERLRDYTITKMDNMLQDPYKIWDKMSFIMLRNLVVCRLTHFNARRGGEPARLTMQQWLEAESDVWMQGSHNAFQNFTEIEHGNMQNYKLAYQPGKNNQLVPTLIPPDTVPAVRKLVEVRHSIDVAKQNKYLFPSTSKSLDSASGWSAISEVAAAAGVQPSAITATKMRHRASTIFASTEATPHVRDAFYRHMGHAKEINEQVYQAPLALMEVAKIGTFFSSIDKGIYHLLCHIKIP